tara:strand:- start:5820 stop:7166 length:1347 start_codon:yes stop_codon:yes gene_type:complete
MNLIEKYNVPGPRYTSYPTVPYWDVKSFNLKTWEERLRYSFLNYGGRLSIYIHLPFCESLCTYCGCNTRITKNHSVEESYVDTLLKEWSLYLKSFPTKPVVKELHLGGGTPTFFSSGNLKRLIDGIFKTSIIESDAELGFEGHPANTSFEHLKTLSELGFDRVSFGIQDFDPKVQQLINRKQSFEQVREVVDQARSLGYNSINFDLIYGLPAQNIESVEFTLEQTLRLRPDRIAFYSYAHVPGIKPAQKSYESFLPDHLLKQELYTTGKKILLENGYADIGMDHFALESDSLYQSFRKGELHRNFMGYTTKKTRLLVGLGASSIGDVWSGFNQNEKRVETYQELVNNGQLPIVKGHLCSPDDMILRHQILNLICRYQTTWTNAEWRAMENTINHELLDQLETDGLIKRYKNKIVITSEGKPFVRNICMAFDAHLLTNKEVKASFSKTI